MAGKKRTRDRVKIIDHYIKTEYPKKGPEWVAETLGESPEYIVTRAHHLKIRRVRPPKPKKMKQPTKVDLQKRIQELEERNKALRLENIKLIDMRRRSA